MDDILFSCRNCVHDSGQGLHIGPGQGFCVKHDTILLDPDDTTCKYHHRKDLPNFVVTEGRSEHAAEFAAFPALASLRDLRPIRQTRYSEKHSWESRTFDPLTHLLAQYGKTEKRWIFVQSFAGSLDGRRTLAHGCMVRRYLDQCGSWTSSYRLVLALLQDLRLRPCFDAAMILSNGSEPAVAEEEARWDVFFSQLAGVQEYGWHAGIEELRWASDGVDGGLSELDWSVLSAELQSACPRWTGLIIEHAKDNGAYFSRSPDEEARDELP